QPLGHRRAGHAALVGAGRARAGADADHRGRCGLLQPERPRRALRAGAGRARRAGHHPVAVGARAGADRAGCRRAARGDGARAVSPAPAPVTVAAPTRTGWRLPAIKAPYVFSSLITLILVVGQLKFGIVGGWERMAAALGTA